MTEPGCPLGRARRFAVTATLVAVFGISAPGPANASRPGGCGGNHWVGAWAASPTDADPGFSRSLAGSTVRTMITPLGGGERLRVRLSNLFGTEPLTVDAGAVARQMDGASVRPRSIRRLKFDGNGAVTIPAGGGAVSDPVALEFKAMRPLAVSTYVNPDSGGSATQHYIGRQTSYIATPTAGNRALDPAGSAFTETTTARFLVTGVDVRAPRRVGAVATFGDSITDGYQGNGSSFTENLAGIDEDVRYPDFLARRLLRRPGPQRLTVLNTGITGNRILEDRWLPTFGPSGLTRLNRDVVSLPGVRAVIVLEGINDIGQTPAAASEVIGGLEQEVKLLEQARLRVLIGTLTPAGGTVLTNYGSASANAIRNQVNEWIRSQSLAAGVVDFDRALRDPSDPSRLLPRFDSSDHLHPSTAGYEAMANAVPLAQLLGSRCG